MKRSAVSSSNIKSVGHDPARNVLEVEFASGQVYQYTGVPPEVAENMLNADSVGSFFAKNVRNQFAATKVESA